MMKTQAIRLTLLCERLVESVSKNCHLEDPSQTPSSHLRLYPHQSCLLSTMGRRCELGATQNLHPRCPHPTHHLLRVISGLFVRSMKLIYRRPLNQWRKPTRNLRRKAARCHRIVANTTLARHRSITVPVGLWTRMNRSMAVVSDQRDGGLRRISEEPAGHRPLTSPLFLPKMTLYMDKRPLTIHRSPQGVEVGAEVSLLLVRRPESLVHRPPHQYPGLHQHRPIHLKPMYQTCKPANPYLHCVTKIREMEHDLFSIELCLVHIYTFSLLTRSLQMISVFDKSHTLTLYQYISMPWVSFW